MWQCETCETIYDEYINGCPHCSDEGIRSGVREVPGPRCGVPLSNGGFCMNEADYGCAYCSKHANWPNTIEVR